MVSNGMRAGKKRRNWMEGVKSSQDTGVWWRHSTKVIPLSLNSVLFLG